MTSRAYQVPLLPDDDDDGVLAEVRLSGDAINWEALLRLAEVAGRAVTPITFTFVTEAPPIFVRLDRAAAALGVTLTQVRRYIIDGHLPVVLAPTGAPRELPHLDSQEPDPADPTVCWLIPWDAMERFAGRARELGHLPTVTPDDKPVRAKGTALAVLVERIVRDAGRAGIRPWEVRDKVEAYYHSTGQPRVVRRGTIDVVLNRLVERGRVLYIPGGKNRTGPRYRHSPED